VIATSLRGACLRARSINLQLALSISISISHLVSIVNTRGGYLITCEIIHPIHPMPSTSAALIQQFYILHTEQRKPLLSNRSI